MYKIQKLATLATKLVAVFSQEKHREHYGLVADDQFIHYSYLTMYYSYTICRPDFIVQSLIRLAQQHISKHATMATVSIKVATLPAIIPMTSLPMSSFCSRLPLVSMVDASVEIYQSRFHISCTINSCHNSIRGYTWTLTTLNRPWHQ